MLADTFKEPNTCDRAMPWMMVFTKSHGVRIVPWLALEPALGSAFEWLASSAGEVIAAIARLNAFGDINMD